MKLRNFLIVLLAVLLVFAFASCKRDPKVDPEKQKQEQEEKEAMDLYPYRNYTPTANQIQVITITEGVETDYWNRDKLKIEWEEEVKAGDTITLKYRSERGIYQWDVRDGDLKWVYESSKNNFEDPVLGEGGWYSFSYTFADKDINGASVEGNSRFGVYFRGNFAEGDIFEIMDVKFNGEPLEIEASNIKSAAELADDTIADHVWTLPRNYAILLATGEVGKEDKHPVIAKVAPGSTFEELLHDVEEDGAYIVSLYSDAAKTTPYDLSKKVLKDAVIVYYTKVGVERTVKFNLNGGTAATAIADVVVLNGQTVAKPATIPTKEGELFAEWCTDAEGTKPYDFTKAVGGDLTLYARYGVPRTVTFDLNGAEGSIAAAIVPDGMTVARPTPDPTNGPYGLETWLLGTEEYDFSTPVTGNITLKAEWSNKTVVTVNLQDGSTPKTFKALLDTPLAADDENLKVDIRPGFIFEGWYDDADCTLAHSFAGNVTGPFTLYAKWTDGTLYNIIATKGDGSSDYDKFILDWQSGALKVNLGDTIAFAYRTTVPFTLFNVRDNETAVDTQKDKWIYESGPETLTSYVEGTDGWTYVSYTFTQKFASSHTPNAGATVTYPAVFRFDLISKNIRPGDILEIKGLTINGEEVALPKVDTCATSFTTIDEMYEWTDKTVTFDTDGGSTIPVATVNYGMKVTKPEDPTKADALFAGWFADDGFTVAFDFNARITKNVTAYAKWADPVVVTFAGTDLEAVTMPKGNILEKPADPTKAENVFGGWYADEGFLAEFDFTVAIDADTTIYAKWVPSWTVTLNLNDGPTPKTELVYVGKGEVMAKPKNPVIAGLYFDGWFTAAEGGDEVDFSAAVNADKTIYAHWTQPTTYYEFTMTLVKKRMALRYAGGGAALDINPQKGDVIAFKFQCPDGKMFDRLYLRNYAGSGQIFVKNDDKSINGFISGPDANNWYTFQYEFGDKLWNGDDAVYPIEGFLLEPIYNSYFAVGDVVKIYGFSYNGEELVIYNDHTKGIRSDEDGGAGDDAKPTLAIKPLSFE